MQRRILDAGRLSGSAVNRQPWLFVVVESEGRNSAWRPPSCNAPRSIEICAFAVGLVTERGGSALDVGRAMQNLFLAAWNEGVASCPNGLADAEAAARALGLEDGLLPVSIPSFAYAKRDLAPQSRSAEEWSAEANHEPLEDVVRRI